MKKINLMLLSFMTGNPEWYIKLVLDGKVEGGTKENNYLGMGADEYYQMLIKGLTRSFTRVFNVFIVIDIIFLIFIYLLRI